MCIAAADKAGTAGCEAHMCQQPHQQTRLDSEFGEGSGHLQADAATAPGHADSSTAKGYLIYDDECKRGHHLRVSCYP